MLKLVSQGLARIGLRSAAAAPAIERARAGEPRIIAGGANAPELCMKPVDPKPGRTLGERRVVQLKGDGLRALHIDGRIVSMEGAPLDCVAHCLAGLKRLEERLGEPFFFDGEYIEDAGYNATIAAHRRGVGNGVLWLFDALPMREWRDDRCTLGLEARLERLAAALPHAESMFIGMLDYWVLGPDDAQRKAEQLWALGYEGIVSKRSRSRYVRRRSDDWVRLKRRVTLDCVIMDLVEKPGAGRAIKSLICRAPDGATLRVACTDAAIAGELLDRRDRGAALPLVEIALNPVTGGGYRGARLERLRLDREEVR